MKARRAYDVVVGEDIVRVPVDEVAESKWIFSIWVKLMPSNRFRARFTRWMTPTQVLHHDPGGDAERVSLLWFSGAQLLRGKKF